MVTVASVPLARVSKRMWTILMRLLCGPKSSQRGWGKTVGRCGGKCLLCHHLWGPPAGTCLPSIPIWFSSRHQFLGQNLGAGHCGVTTLFIFSDFPNQICQAQLPSSAPLSRELSSVAAILRRPWVEHPHRWWEATLLRRKWESEPSLCWGTP